MVKPLVSPWIEAFDHVVGSASRSLLVCSPFIGRQPCLRIATALSHERRQHVSLFVFTDLSIDNMLSAATDVGALRELVGVLPRTEVRCLPRIHAKAYIADEHCAVVTSANLTDSGLSKNLEYGLMLCDDTLVRQVRNDLMQYGALGSVVDAVQLSRFEGFVADLRQIRIKAERTMSGRFRREFARRLRAADREILSIRAQGLSQHSAFADTILYVLKGGPKDTRTIYSEVQRIHPDLCDDTIKLVIKGEAWNQAKWRQRVRHAQLFLKRQGRIVREAGN